MSKNFEQQQQRRWNKRQREELQAIEETTNMMKSTSEMIANTRFAIEYYFLENSNGLFKK